MTDPLKPSAALLCKLGSIAVHTEEFLSPDGHPFDKVALNTLLSDPDIKAWLSAMDAMAMLPKKRIGK
jgi:hypothetical protein